MTRERIITSSPDFLSRTGQNGSLEEFGDAGSTADGQHLRKTQLMPVKTDNPRGRPPKNPGVATAAAVPNSKPRRGRKGMSGAARKAQSARMKKYWAARRKQRSA